MSCKVKIVKDDGTKKHLTIGDGITLPAEFSMATSRFTLLITNLEALKMLLETEGWKSIEIEKS